MFNQNVNPDGPNNIPPVQGVPFVPLINPEQMQTLAITVAHLTDRLHQVTHDLIANTQPTPAVGAAPSSGVSLSVGAPPNPSAPDFPFDPSFDPNDFDGMLRKLQAMIAWMRANGGNVNAIPVFFEFLVNMGKQYGSMSIDHQKLLNKTLGDFLHSGSVSFGDMMIQFLVQFKFYESGGDKDVTRKYLADLIAMLSPIASQNPWLQDLLNAANSMTGPKGKLEIWMNDPTKPANEKDFLIIMQGVLGFFMQKVDLTSWVNSYYSDLISRIMQMKNPELVFYMLLALLIDRSDDQITDMGGLAAIIQRMRDMGADITQITAMFRGTFTADSAKDFVEKLKTLRLQFANDPALDDATRASALAQIDSILNVPVDGGGTLQQLYDQCAAKKDFTALSTILNRINSQPTIPAFQTIVSALSSLGSTTTNFSLIMTQKVQQAQANLEQFLAFIKSGYDMFKMVETINRNMAAG
jgi:hypothetical protein